MKSKSSLTATLILVGTLAILATSYTQAPPPPPPTINLVGRAPVIVHPGPGQTVAQLLIQEYAGIAAGTIKGDQSGLGKMLRIAVVDNADLGADTINGVAVLPNDVILVQAEDGDTNLDHLVNSDDYNDFVGGVSRNWTNGPNWVLGCFNSSDGITLGDWYEFLGVYNAAQYKNQVDQAKAAVAARAPTLR